MLSQESNSPSDTKGPLSETDMCTQTKAGQLPSTTETSGVQTAGRGGEGRGLKGKAEMSKREDSLVGDL